LQLKLNDGKLCAMAKKSGVNTSELGGAVRRRREQQSLSLRDVAEQTGVSASTLSRIENGTGKPDADNISRLASWLDMPIERVMHHGHRSPSDPKPVVYYPHESTPEIVEAHLRADKHLTAETAKALSELFRVAYTQFSHTSGEKSSRKRG
jgi:transcriptional regulator with XRE-family HTH domain